VPWKRRSGGEEGGQTAGQEGVAQGGKGEFIGVDAGGGTADVGGAVGIGEGDEHMGFPADGLNTGPPAGRGFEDGAGFRRDDARSGQQAAGGPVDVGGDEEAPVVRDELRQPGEGQVGGAAEVAGDEFKDVVVLVDDRLVPVAQGIVGHVGEMIKKQIAEGADGLRCVKKGQDVDALGGAGFDAVEGAESFAAAGGGEGGGVAGAVVVGQGRGV